MIDGPNGAGSVETVTVNVNGVHSAHPRDDGNSSSGVVHGITQGELLRQEQEAGIVPVPAATPNGRVTRSSAAASAAAIRAVGGDVEHVVDPEETAEPVHARGPDVIGMEDMGPQTPGSGLAGGIDLEGALGRRGEGESMAATVGREAGEEAGEGLGVKARGEEAGEKEREESESEKEKGKAEILDSDGDIVVTDADGGADGSGQNQGPDAVDGTAL